MRAARTDPDQEAPRVRRPLHRPGHHPAPRPRTRAGRREPVHRRLDQRGCRPKVGLPGRDHPPSPRLQIGGARPGPPHPAAHPPPTHRDGIEGQALHRHQLSDPRLVLPRPPQTTLVPRRPNHRPRRHDALPQAPPDGPRPPLHHRLQGRRKDLHHKDSSAADVIGQVASRVSAERARREGRLNTSTAGCHRTAAGSAVVRCVRTPASRRRKAAMMSTGSTASAGPSPW